MNIMRWRMVLTLAALLAVFCVGSSRADAQDVEGGAAPKAFPKAPSGDMVNIDFNDVDIKLFVKFMAELTGKNFVIDEKVKGKVTIISPKKVSHGEAMKVFESTMEVYGYALIEAGNIVKIVPATEARHRSPFKAGQKTPGDRMMTRLLPLKYIRANELVSMLRPLIPPTSFITSYARTNTLILADYSSNIKKIVTIVTALDTPGHEEMVTVIQLKYAGAKELAKKLQKTFGITKGRGRGSSSRPGKPGRPRLAGNTGGWSRNDPKIIADDRINSLVVVADKIATDSILSLVEQLDIKAPPGRGNINVVYLKNADAEELAKTLNSITKPQTRKKNKQRGAPGTSVKLTDNVVITPDKATNSLVITASVEDYVTIRDVIEKLDTRRLQVFVEALIMEVTSTQQKKFGVEWRTTADFNESGEQVIGGFGAGVMNSVAANPLNAPQGLVIGVVDGIISWGGKDFLNLGALVHALQSETGINILSTPNLMTTDNEEAEIIVAQNVPFVTGQSQTTGGSTLTTIERKNVGITLRLTPQISESEEVRLTVFQEISSISPTQLEKAQDLITFTRSVKTTVVVKDRQNIVIGGLIRDDVNEVETKVPLFGDIPLLGWLFKSKSKQLTKTNLLIFLRPHIIRNDADLEALKERRGNVLEMAPPELQEKLPSDLRPPAPEVDDAPDAVYEDDDEQEEGF
ncbi:General secretion pathway protein D [hydrothermal vent metagenome]|uniref:General secretion pathway protein D n=1 Tax=hydrothermal vent metagenome TaxID=652676 RepID=A0A3B1BZW2_9ZZZZ